MILGFGDGLTCWFPLAERHPRLMQTLFGVPHDGADEGKPHPVADLIDCELSEFDDFPAGEPPLYDGRPVSAVWVQHEPESPGGCIGYADPYEHGLGWRARAFFRGPYGFRRYRLAEIGWFFPWVVEQGETIARELASWFYCEGCHESYPLEDGEGGDGLCWACYECCACEWEQGCGGTGVVHCRGCGGDQCICTCGGELECDGCDDCEHDDVSSPEDDGYDSDYSDE